MSDWMRQLDTDYRKATGLEARADYSIFYSQVAPSPILILGWNPGGDPATWTEEALASSSLYEHGEHEYVDCHYRIARVMRELLEEALDLDGFEPIRKIPKSNIIFRRSRAMDGLSLSDAEALDEAQPFVQRIIRHTNPELILLEGMGTFDRFLRRYCSDVRVDPDDTPITTPNGPGRATIFQSASAIPKALGRPVTVLGLGHPSRYGGRREWPEVTKRCKAHLRSVTIG
jgi:hypothetical protein